jgi:predicted Zn-dependent protease
MQRKGDGRHAHGGKVSPLVVLVAVVVPAAVVIGLALRAAQKGAAPAPAGGAVAEGSAAVSAPVAGGAPVRAPAAKIDEVLNASLALERDQKWGQARGLLEEAVRTHPEEQALHAQLGAVLMAMGENGEAYASFERALATGPREGELEFSAGTAASKAGRLDRAEEHYGAAQAALKTDYRPPLFLAQVQIKLKRFEEAKKSLLTSAHLKADVGVTWGTLADLALRENAATLALQHIERARELEPQVTLWRLIEARALKRLGKAQEALDLLVGLTPEQQLEAGVLSLMGECYGVLQQPGRAAALYASFADRFAERGDLSLEAALWFERAGEGARAAEYARRAELLGVEGAKEVVGRLGG